MFRPGNDTAHKAIDSTAVPVAPNSNSTQRQDPIQAAAQIAHETEMGAHAHAGDVDDEDLYQFSEVVVPGYTVGE